MSYTEVYDLLSIEILVINIKTNAHSKAQRYSLLDIPLHDRMVRRIPVTVSFVDIEHNPRLVVVWKQFGKSAGFNNPSGHQENLSHIVGGIKHLHNIIYVRIDKGLATNDIQISLFSRRFKEIHEYIEVLAGHLVLFRIL